MVRAREVLSPTAQSKGSAISRVRDSCAKTGDYPGGKEDTESVVWRSLSTAFGFQTSFCENW